MITGVSGVGKRTLIQHLESTFPDTFGHIVSHTTRKRRHNESEGIDYKFVSEKEFKKIIELGDFLEYTKKDNNALYGTSKWKIKNCQHQRRIPLLELNVTGTEQFLKEYPEANTLFVFPPSIEELKERLQNRGGYENPE